MRRHSWAPWPLTGCILCSVSAARAPATPTLKILSDRQCPRETECLLEARQSIPFDVARRLAVFPHASARLLMTAIAELPYHVMAEAAYKFIHSTVTGICDTLHTVAFRYNAAA